jgi:hypothetical protein
MKDIKLDLDFWFNKKLKKEVGMVFSTSLIGLLLVFCIYLGTHSKFLHGLINETAWSAIEDIFKQDWWFSTALSMSLLSLILSFVTSSINSVRIKQLRETADKAISDEENIYNLEPKSQALEISVGITEDLFDCLDYLNIFSIFFDLGIISKETLDQCIYRIVDSHDREDFSVDLLGCDIYIFIIGDQSNFSWIKDCYRELSLKNKTIAIFIERDKKKGSSKPDLELIISFPPEKIVFFSDADNLEKEIRKFFSDMLVNSYRKSKKITDELSSIQGRYKAKKIIDELVETQSAILINKF